MDISEVTETPNADGAAQLLLDSAPLDPPAAVAPATGDAAPALKAKRSHHKKGGDTTAPKGKPGRPRKARGIDYVASAVNDAPAAAAQVQDGPVPATPRPSLEPADPQLVESVKRPLSLAVRAITRMLERMMGREGIAATEEEAQLIAEAGAVVLVMRAPRVAESSPELALLVAIASYALPRVELFTGTIHGPELPAGEPTP